MGNFFGKKKEVKNEKNSEVPIVNNKPSNVAIFGAGCYWGTEKFFKSSHNPAWRSVLEGIYFYQNQYCSYFDFFTKIYL